MRIKSIYLENYFGIYEGLGLYELYIDCLPDQESMRNKITAIIGKNGSGKTVLLSQLTPFNLSFDGRKDLILPGEIGRKTIVILDGADEYTCDMTLKPNANSFSFLKNGVELNTSGKIGSYEELVEKELLCTKDILKITRIGANTEHLVDMGATDRKAYITPFIEAVNKFIDSFTIVADKVKISKAKIKTLADNLAKLETKDVLESKKLTLDKQLADINTSLMTEGSKKLNMVSNIAKMEKELSETDIDEVRKNRKTLENAIKTLNTNNSVLTSKYSGEELKQLIDNLEENTKSRNEFKEALATATAICNSKYERIVEYENKIQKITNTINGIEKGEIELLEEEKKLIEDDIKTFEDNINGSGIHTLFESYTGDDSVSFLYETLKLFIETLLEKVDIIKTQSSSIAEVNLLEDWRDIQMEKTRKINSEIVTKNKTVADFTNKLASKNSNIEKLDILERRPKDCKNDTCPFIQDALKYSNLTNEIAELNAKLNESNDDVKKSTLLVETIHDLYSTMQPMYETKRNVKKENPFWIHFIDTVTSLEELVSKTPREIGVITTDFRTAMENYVYNISKISELKQKLDAKVVALTKLTSTSEILKLHNQELETEKTELEKAKLEYNELWKNKGELTEKDIMFTNLVNEGSAYKEVTDKVDRYSDKLEEIIEEEENYSKLFLEYTTLKDNTFPTLVANIMNLEKSKSECEESKIKIDNDLVLINTYTKDELELQNSYSKLELVYKALDPKSGIPLVFIQSFMGMTEKMANDLLDIAFGGDFRIKFVSNSKEFAIQVITENGVKSDVKIASQGQLALTTIAISLALIEKASHSSKFNIVCLDEMDAALDPKHKRSFVDILLKLTRNLDIEQLFIISHNAAFAGVDMNLILLKGSKWFKRAVGLEGKKILYEFPDDDDDYDDDYDIETSSISDSEDLE